MSTPESIPSEAANSDFSGHSPALGDWRLAATFWATGTTEAAWDTPRAGVQVTSFHAEKIQFSFPTPSAAALHLNMAWKCAKRCAKLREQVIGNLHAPKTGASSLQFDGDMASPLFDVFEELIGTVSGSFAAVEAFCNRIIVETASGPIKVKRRKDHEELSPEDVVRWAPIEEKIKRIVPDLLGVSSPAGKAVYQHFIRVKTLRDSVTHFKRHDEARMAGKLHEPTPLFELFLLDQFSIPEHAMEVIRYFKPGDNAPRWLMNPEWVRPVNDQKPAKGDMQWKIPIDSLPGRNAPKTVER